MVKLFGRRETLVVTAAGLERKHQQEGAHKRSAQPSGRAVARASGKHDVGHGEPFCPGSFYLDLLLAATYTRSGIGEDMRLPKLASLNLRTDECADLCIPEGGHLRTAEGKHPGIRVSCSVCALEQQDVRIRPGVDPSSAECDHERAGFSDDQST